MERTVGHTQREHQAVSTGCRGHPAWFPGCPRHLFPTLGRTFFRLLSTPFLRERRTRWMRTGLALSGHHQGRGQQLFSPVPPSNNYLLGDASPLASGTSCHHSQLIPQGPVAGVKVSVPWLPSGSLLVCGRETESGLHQDCWGLASICFMVWFFKIGRAHV